MSIIAVMAVPSDVYQGSLTPGRLAAKDDSPQKARCWEVLTFSAGARSAR
jgi:hypothetical protein